MKKQTQLLRRAGMVISLFFLLISCKKEDVNVSNSITKEVEKIESMYVAGNNKVETFLGQGETKIESRASDAYMEKILMKSELHSFKQKQSSKTSDRVGVIKENGQSCGSYDLLEITMDCEDYRNANSSYGWKGDNVVTGNVTLKFCLVPKSVFQSSKYYKYAVLSLDYGWVSMIERYYDNEDGSSINSVKLNGTTLTADQIYEQLGSGIVQGNNTQLCYIVYGQDPVNGMETFPDISIPYGVFGYFNVVGSASAKGYIYTDDQDTNNANAEWYNWYYIPKAGNETYFLYVQDLIKPTDSYGRNTTMYMSRVRI